MNRNRCTLYIAGLHTWYSIKKVHCNSGLICLRQKKKKKKKKKTQQEETSVSLSSRNILCSMEKKNHITNQKGCFTGLLQSRDSNCLDC